MLPLRVLDALRKSLQGPSGSIMFHKESVNVFPERPHDESHHHTFQDGIQVQEFVRLQLQSLLLHFFLELPLAVLYQVVLHAGHELPHVPHHHVRTGFLALLRALDEVVDVLGEGGSLVRRQLEGVGPYCGACASVIAVPEGLQPWRSWKLKNQLV